jgi:uncharacterized protein (TIGR02266 family)
VKTKAGKRKRRPARAVQRVELESGELQIVEAPRTRLFTQLDLHTQSNFYSGFSGGLADGGLFVATYEPLTLGQPVHVELSLPGGQFLAADGRVAWLRDPLHGADLAPGAGIVFEQLDEGTLKAVTRFMAQREPTFVDPD